jgi:hypothetical protein
MPFSQRGRLSTRQAAPGAWRGACGRVVDRVASGSHRCNVSAIGAFRDAASTSRDGHQRPRQTAVHDAAVDAKHRTQRWRGANEPPVRTAYGAFFVRALRRHGRGYGRAGMPDASGGPVGNPPRSEHPSRNPGVNRSGRVATRRQRSGQRLADDGPRTLAGWLERRPGGSHETSAGHCSASIRPRSTCRSSTARVR